MLRRRSVSVGLLVTIGSVLVGLLFIRSVAVARSAPAAQARKHILVLHDEDKDLFPGLARIDRSLRESFESEFGGTVEVYSESLSLSRFERAGYERVVADFYRSKFASTRFDLVVAVMEPSLEFLLKHGDASFPGAPIVFSGVDASAIAGKTLPANVTGVVMKRAFAPTLEIALRLQPDTRHVFVVGGASTFDRNLEALVRRDVQRFEGRVTVTYLTGLSMDASLKAVSSLPAHSVILYTTLFADGAGVGFVPHQALSSIAAAANAPVYVFVDQYVGRGAVGGNVYSVDTHGSQVAALGSRIMRGAPPASLPIRELGAQIDMFDARQLSRWKLDDTRLPPGSVIRFRDASVWELYRWYIVGAIGLVMIESALIAGLLVARARRQRAEAEALQQREELAHVLRVATLSELTTSLAHEINQPLAAILANAQSASRFLGSRPSADKDVEEVLIDIAADARRAEQIITRLRMLFRKEHVQQAPVSVNALIEDVMSLLRTAMLTSRIEVRLMLAEALPPVLGDAVQLEQVVLNVVVNASEAIGMAEDGPRVITIQTGQPQPGRLTFEVRDTGVGIKDADLERIFEHFVTTKPQGLGMGLAISRSIIRAHGGRMWATANPDRGLTMHIELPCGGTTGGDARAVTAAA